MVAAADKFVNDVFNPVWIQKPAVNGIKPFVKCECQIEELWIHCPEIVEAITNSAMPDGPHFLVIHNPFMVKLLCE